jgi:translocation and assembly module TamB
MSWFRLVFVALSSLLLLFLVLLGLVLFTSAGNQLLWQQLRAQLPELQGELVDGHLGQGWSFRDIDYRSSLLDVQADALTLNWQPGALLSGQLLIDELTLKKGHLTLHPHTAVVSPSGTVSVATPDELIQLPVAVHLKHLEVSDFLLRTPEVRVAVGHLQAAANWQGSHLQLAPSEGADVDVELLPQPAKKPAKPEAEAKPLAKPFDRQSIQQQIESLPKVFLPFELEVVQLNVKRARYHQLGFDTGLFDVQTQVQFTGLELQIQQLNIRHPLGELALNGQMTFHDYYPMQFEVKGLSKVPWLEKRLSGRRATLTVSGPLTDLKNQLVLEGQEGVVMTARLNTLAPDLPFESELLWKHLQWPLRPRGDKAPANKAPVDYEFRQGSLKASGRLSAYQASLRSQARILDLPATQLDLALKGSLSGIEVLPLKVTTGKSRAEVTGTLDWRHGLRWQGKLAAQSSNLGEWLPDLSGRVTSTVQTEFTMENQHWQLKLPSIQASGQLNGYPLTLSGKLSGDDRMAWRFEQIQLNSGGNQLKLDGELGSRWRAEASLLAPRLGVLYPSLEGAVTGHFSLRGTADKPSVTLALQAEQLALPGLRLRNLDANGSLSLGAVVQGELQVRLGRLRSGSTLLQDLVLSLRGTDQDHTLQLQFKGKPLATHIAMQGRWTGKAWQGELSTGELETPVGRWKLESPLTLTVPASMASVTLGQQCWRSDKSALCLAAAELSGTQGDLDIALTDFATEKLQPFFPDHMDWMATLGLHGTVGWNKAGPHANLQLVSESGKLVADEFTSGYDQLSISSQLDDKQGSLVLHFASKQLGKADINLLISDPMGERQLGGELSISNLRLYGIAPLFDELKSTRGRIDAQGRMAGSLSKPLFYGRVALSEGEIESSAELAYIKELHTELVVDGAKAELSGDMKVGKGTLTLNGNVDWSQEPLSGQLRVHADTLEVGLAGYGRARVSSNLALTFGSLIRLEGQVQIPWARIKVKSLPDSAVGISDDVVIINPHRKPAPPAKPLLPIWLDVSLGLGGDVQLDALGLKTKLVGGVRVVQNPDTQLRMDGEIALNDGRFKSFGQNLLIQEGKLQFSGNPTAPYLFVKAERDPETMEDKDVTVGVKVSGPASQPRIEIYSEPQLSQSEKLSYLLRGKSSSSSGSTSNDEAMTGILLGAGLSQANGLVSGIVENFGFSDVSLDSSGSGDKTQVSISGYLMPGLQLQYGVGVFTSISEVRLRYELMPRLYVQALSGLNQALDLFYKFEF